MTATFAGPSGCAASHRMAAACSGLRRARACRSRRYPLQSTRGRTRLNRRMSKPSRARFASEPLQRTYSSKVIPRANRSGVMARLPCRLVNSRLAALRCGPVTARRLPVALLVVYVVFVAYGSFFPFNFTYDPHALQRLLDSPFPRLHDASGRRLVSLPDLVANGLLGAPVGILTVWSGLGGAGLVTRLLAVIVLDATVASAVEIGQLFLPGRTASLTDVIAQVIGSVVAALVTHALLAGSTRPAGPRLAAALRRRPALAGLLVVTAVLAADAFYPFAVTLDVSTVRENLKAGTWRPLAGLARSFWPDLVVEKTLAYAVAAVLARATLRSLSRDPAGLLAWLATTALAMGLEVGKLMIVGRAPNV